MIQVLRKRWIVLRSFGPQKEFSIYYSVDQVDPEMVRVETLLRELVLSNQVSGWRYVCVFECCRWSAM